MKRVFRITQAESGQDLGVYDAETPEEAIREMLTEAGEPEAEPDPGLRVTELVEDSAD